MRFLLVVVCLLPLQVSALASFKITIQDRVVKIESPKDVSKTYSVIVENKSLSDILGKFHSNGEDLKFISVKTNSSKSVEFHQSKNKVYFKILSPAFQELAVEAGKKSYEVPSVQ